MVGISGCSATGGETAGSFALALPETVAVTPQSFAPGTDAGAAAAATTAGMAAADTVSQVAVAADTPEVQTVAAAEARSTAKGDRLVAKAAALPETPAAVPAAAGVPEQVAVANAFAAPQKPALAAVEGLATQDRSARKSGRGHLDELIAKYAAAYSVPVDLVHKVVRRESNYRPEAYSRGNWGLMQIRHATARGMGYDGPAKGLLDAETNLKYAVKYLRGAYIVAGGDHARADRLYQTGYYYHAKRAGLLDETGLGKDRKRRRN